MLHRLILLFLVFGWVSLGGHADAETDEFAKRQQQYRSACQTLGAPNIDCTCVGKLHATWSHLSPSPEYADFLYQMYRNNIGLTHQMDESLAIAAGSLGGETGFMLAQTNSFDPYSDADPFQDNSVGGCVIPGAARASVPAAPRSAVFADYLELAQTTLGWQRQPQCVVGELEKLFDEPTFDAHFRRTRKADSEEQIAADFGVSVGEVEAMIARASGIYDAMGVTSRNPDNYCMARLAAEDYGTGEIRARFVRSDAERLGPPLGLESIDVTRPAPKPVDQMALAMAEMEAVRAEMEGAPSREDVLAEAEAMEEFQMAKRIQQGGAADITRAEQDAACLDSGYDQAFCGCFSEGFEKDIAPQSGSSKAALLGMVIGQGLPAEKMVSLMQGADDATVLRMTPAIQSLVQTCEATSNQAAVSETLNGDGGPRDQYERICLHGDPDNTRFCSCAADHLDENLEADELKLLVRIEGASLTETEFSEIAGEMGMSEEQAAMAIATNPRITSAMMGLMGACF
ncbi:MAG: hypothetical protein AAFQ15_06320 [Pseudomonadota bacterium]